MLQVMVSKGLPRALLCRLVHCAITANVKCLAILPILLSLPGEDFVNSHCVVCVAWLSLWAWRFYLKMQEKP